MDRELCHVGVHLRVLVEVKVGARGGRGAVGENQRRVDRSSAIMRLHLHLGQRLDQIAGGEVAERNGVDADRSLRNHVEGARPLGGVTAVGGVRHPACCSVWWRRTCMKLSDCELDPDAVAVELAG